MTKRVNVGFVIVELLAVVSIIVFIACVSEGPVREDVTLAELSETALSAMETEEEFSLADSQDLRKYYGLDASEYEDVLLYLPSSNMDAAELLIVVMEDESQADEMEEAMNERLETQKQAFESYGVEQMGILNQAVICVKGRYGLFAVCSDADAVKAAFLDTVEK